MTQLELLPKAASCTDETHIATCDTFPLCECGKERHPLHCSYEEAVEKARSGDSRYGNILEDSGEDHGND